MSRLRLVALYFLLLSFSITIAHAEDGTTPAGISPDAIAAYPQPDVRPLTPNEELMYDRIYKQISGAVDIYGSPGGEVVGRLDAGFNFVTVNATQGDWVMIDDNERVQASALQDALVSRFAGVRLPDETLPYPFGWVLVHTRASQQPGVEALDTDPFYYRYTLVNLYDSVDVNGWTWYQVGVDQWIQQTQIAKFLPIERPAEVDTERWISVDLYEQVVIAYEGDTPVFTTLISSGMADWTTNEGLFHIYIRYPRTLMSGADGQPDFYYLEEVPWTMYFDDDIALHGTYWHDGFGFRHSHGCVNMSITDAYWLYDWVAPEFDYSVDNDLGPAVYVYSSGQYR